MPNGDIKAMDYRQFRALLLDAQTASHTGTWVEIPGGFPFRSWQATSLEEGASDAVVSIQVSNDETKPSDATDGDETASLVVATPAASRSESYRWIKAKKTAGTTPIATTVSMVCTKGE